MKIHQRNLPRVVIIGGGFGGLEAAKALRKADVRVTLLDRSYWLIAGDSGNASVELFAAWLREQAKTSCRRPESVKVTSARHRKREVQK